MDYKKIYESLIHKGKHRTLCGYKETHHIIPRCLGGSDDVENLVELTPEEHYLAHQLLVKLYPNNKKLIYAATAMVANRPSNKLYGWLKRRFSLEKSKEQSGTGNSQFDTCWIYHDIFGSRRIKKDLLVQYIDQGWFLGKTLKYEKPKKKRLYIDANKRILEIEEYRKYYDIYKKVGFDEFVRITGYTKSKPNLVQRFSVLLEEFVPQNGKKRQIRPGWLGEGL